MLFYLKNLFFSVRASVHQRPHHDRDGGVTSQGEDLHLKEARQIPQLDRSSHQGSVFYTNPGHLYIHRDVIYLAWALR